MSDLLVDAYLVYDLGDRTRWVAPGTSDRVSSHRGRMVDPLIRGAEVQSVFSSIDVDNRALPSL